MGTGASVAVAELSSFKHFSSLSVILPKILSPRRGSQVGTAFFSCQPLGQGRARHQECTQWGDILPKIKRGVGRKGK